MPALSTIKHDNKMKHLYERVCERNGWKNKKSGIIAVMRKLLHIIFALWKNDTEYDLVCYENEIFYLIIF